MQPLSDQIDSCLLLFSINYYTTDVLVWCESQNSSIRTDEKNELLPLRTARCLPETVICLQRTVGGGRTVRVVLTVDGGEEDLSNHVWMLI